MSLLRRLTGRRPTLVPADPDTLLRRVGESLTGIPFQASDELRPDIPYRRRAR